MLMHLRLLVTSAAPICPVLLVCSREVSATKCSVVRTDCSEARVLVTALEVAREVSSSRDSIYQLVLNPHLQYALCLWRGVVMVAGVECCSGSRFLLCAYCGLLWSV